MTRYRSRPSEIEAVQWKGENWEEVHAFCSVDEEVRTASTMVRLNEDEVYAGHPLQLLAGKDGAQGWVPVPVGHWIVRNPGDLTDHWPVDPDYFAAKYERA